MADHDLMTWMLKVRFHSQKYNIYINKSINQSTFFNEGDTQQSGTDKPVALGFRIELEFGNVGFWGEGKTGVPGEKPLGAKTRTNNKLNPHMSPGPGVEPGPHWWEASALTIAPSLLPAQKFRIVKYAWLEDTKWKRRAKLHYFLVYYHYYF